MDYIGDRNFGCKLFLDKQDDNEQYEISFYGNDKDFLQKTIDSLNDLFNKFGGKIVIDRLFK